MRLASGHTLVVALLAGLALALLAASVAMYTVKCSGTRSSSVAGSVTSTSLAVSGCDWDADNDLCSGHTRGLYNAYVDANHFASYTTGYLGLKQSALFSAKPDADAASKEGPWDNTALKFVGSKTSLIAATPFPCTESTDAYPCEQAYLVSGEGDGLAGYFDVPPHTQIINQFGLVRRDDHAEVNLRPVPHSLCYTYACNRIRNRTFHDVSGRLRTLEKRLGWCGKEQTIF